MNGRIVILGLIAAFTAIVLLLFQSIFWSPSVSSWMQLAVLAMALLSYFRPQYGLLALAALVPLGQVGSRTLDSQMRGAEALVLAFLAGALVRGWTLREFRGFPSTRVETAALVFGLIVAASCAEQIWFLQIQRDYAWPFVSNLLTYASRGYLATFGNYGMIFHAMLLLEGVALLLFTASHTTRSPEFSRQLATALVLGAVTTSLLTFQDVATELRSLDAQSSLLGLVLQRRWSTHVADVNAAGSFFAMAMFVAFGLAFGHRRGLPGWIAGGLVSLGAMVLTRSRTAIVAVMLVTACLVVIWTVGRFIGTKKAVAFAMVTLPASAVTLWLLLPRELFGPFASDAVRVRWLFLGTTWRMLVANPLFGVGVGQYPLWSYHFSAPELLAFYKRENAHNNFSQIAGELGVVGLVVFAALLALAFRARSTRPSAPDLATVAVTVGVAAFVLSWLGGHPLLVPEVAYPFWLALGVVAAGSLATSSARYANALAAIAFTLLVLSVPWRVHAKSQTVDFSQVSYGLSAKSMMASRSRFFVPAGTRRVDIPLRSHSNDEQPLVVEVLVDGVAGHTVELTGREWHTAKVALPEPSSRRFHQIDLRMRPAEATDAEADRLSIEVGNWAIISTPNG